MICDSPNGRFRLSDSSSESFDKRCWSCSRLLGFTSFLTERTVGSCHLNTNPRNHTEGSLFPNVSSDLKLSSLVGFTFKVTTASLLSPWPEQEQPMPMLDL